MKAAVLGGARVIYLALMGVAFFVAATRVAPAELGVYALASSYAALVTVLLTLGMDRVILVRAARDGPAQLLRARRPTRQVTFLILVAAVLSSRLQPEVIAAAVIAASRLQLNDLESLGLGVGKSHRVSVATITNGVIGASLTIAVAPWGAVWLLWASAAGNLVAVAVLSLPSLVPSTAPTSAAISLRESWHFAVISLVGVLYVRAGMSILPLRGVGPKEIASFAVAFKAFEFIVAGRGALVQHYAAALAAGSSQRPHGRVIAGAVSLGTGISVVGLVGAWTMHQVGVLEEYDDVWLLVSLVAICAPLIASHAVTSALVYSSAGQNVLLRDSILLASIALVLSAIGAGFGTGVVVVTTCAMEYVWFVALGRRFADQGYHHTAWTLSAPLVASSAVLAVWLLLGSVLDLRL